MRKDDSCRGGSVLVLVLIVVSAMTIVAFGLAYQTRIEMKLSKADSKQAILENLVLSGLEAAKAVLSEKELIADQAASVCRFYAAKDTLKLFEQLKLPLAEDASVAFSIIDESSLLDLNKSNSAVWENLPDFGREKRACILDWIDTDSDLNPDGAETDYYERLEPPLACKNAPFAGLKELLFVKNVTRDDYLGKLLKAEILSPDDMELLLSNDATQQISLINTFTAFGQEQVNINTVSGQILSILPGLDRQAANTVLAYRSGPDGAPNTDDDRLFEKLEDIAEIEGLSDLQKELLGQYCCFTSDTFRVFSLAKNDRQLYVLMATIRSTEKQPKIICVERLL